MRQREQYLEALGIDVWKPRAGAPNVASAAAPTAALVAVTGSAVSHAASAAVGATDASGGNAGSDRVDGGRVETSDAVWEALRTQVSGCTRCELCKTRTQTVFGVGNRRAKLLVIGEAPGADEDRQGEPFVGRAGQLLNSMLHAMGNPRASVYIANILKCRPPGNRDPSPSEVASCMPYLQQQIEMIQPLMMLAVGRIAAQNLLATDTPIGRLRGQVHRFGTRATPLIVTYHPAYLLRSPSEKRKAWTDLKFARAELAKLGSVPAS